MIKITPKFTTAQIRKMLLDKIALIDLAILQRMEVIGEKFVRNARATNTYKDQTGNLRSSIGYAILKNGKVIKRAINKPKKGATHLIEDPEEILNDVAERHPKGFVFVGLAFMGYAASVESKSLDVITSSAIVAEQDWKKSLQELEQKLKSKTKK